MDTFSPNNGKTELRRPGPHRILTFTTLFPGATRPNHGIFVENRLRHLVGTGRVRARVVAPVPWFPFSARYFGRYAAMARMPEREFRHGIEVDHPRYIAIPKIGMSISPVALFAGVLPVLRRLSSDFELIDSHYFYPDGVAAVLLGRALNKPVVITARGSDVNLIPRHPLARQMIRYAAQHAAGVVAVSQALKDVLTALGVAPERMIVLRNGVDLSMFRPGDRDAARAALNVHGPVLVSVGHLVEPKGHALTIRALPQLASCTLLIVGEGPERPRLKAVSAQLGVADRVRFLGALPHERLREVYVAADILVLASSREGWPNVLLEALACGTPVVASAVGGIREIVSRPEAGVLMRARTPEDVAEAIKKLLNSPPTRTATRIFAEQFSWNETSAGQIRLFEQILATSREVGHRRS